MKGLERRIGNPRGHNTNKEHRAQKLVNRWSMLRKKMIRMVVRGKGESTQARCAWGVLVMMDTAIRVGNEGSAQGYVCMNKYLPEYGKIVKTYGLITLQRRHAQRQRGKLYLNFVGKKSVHQRLVVSEPAIVDAYGALSGRGCPPDAPLLGISAYDLKKFTKRYVGRAFTPKDMRTAAVNLRFIENTKDRYHRAEVASIQTKKDAKIALNDLIEETAEQIGHTKGVCKGSYLSKQLVGYYHEQLLRRTK